jgi:hypothetical protein
MIGLGFAEMLVLALMAGGFNASDLISAVEPTHYFKARQMEISVDRAIDYAGEEAKSPKMQIIQLSALRYLADQSAALKKSPNYADYVKTLQQIAAGKKGADPQGFARDYAERVLVKLGESKGAELKMPRPLREEAFAWFPSDITMGGAIDMQHAQVAGGADPVRDLVKLIPEQARMEMYNVIEKIGNVRVERFAIGIVDSPGKKDKMKIFMRITGKANQDWLIDAFQGFGGRQQAKRIKDANDTPITLMQDRNRSPILGLVGNSDILIIGYAGGGDNPDGLVDEVLEVRAKKKANPTAGVLKDRLAKVPDKAVGLFVGNIPEDAKREFRFIDPIPQNITAFVERTKEGLDVQATSSMSGVDEADKLVRKVADLRKQGIEEVKKAMQMPRRPGEPPLPFQSMINVLESLQVNSKEGTVRVRVVVPESFIREMTNTLMLFGARAGPDLPPPPKDEGK